MTAVVLVILMALVGYISDPTQPVVLRGAGGHAFILHTLEGSRLITVDEASRQCEGGKLPPLQRQSGMIACVFPLSRIGITYVAVDSCRGNTPELLNAAEESAFQEYRRTTPDLVLERWEAAQTGDNRSVRVAILHFDRDRSEAVAFIGERNAVVRIGTWTLERDGGSQRALEILRAIVGSYASVSEPGSGNE